MDGGLGRYTNCLEWNKSGVFIGTLFYNKCGTTMVTPLSDTLQFNKHSQCVDRFDVSPKL